MNFRKVITDRIRRIRGQDEALQGLIVESWRELVDALPIEDLEPALRVRVDALLLRVTAADGVMDAQLTHDIATNQHELAQVVRDFVVRDRMLREGTRKVRREASAHELRLAQLQDELGRVRDLIADECRRRNIRQPTIHEDMNLVDELYKLFEGISGRGSRRMQSVGEDPAVRELLRLLESEDPKATDRFPRWLREPATRIVTLVIERNRYRQLLENSGLMPPKS